MNGHTTHTRSTDSRWGRKAFREVVTHVIVGAVGLFLGKLVWEPIVKAMTRRDPDAVLSRYVSVRIRGKQQSKEQKLDMKTGIDALLGLGGGEEAAAQLPLEVPTEHGFVLENELVLRVENKGKRTARKVRVHLEQVEDKRLDGPAIVRVDGMPAIGSGDISKRLDDDGDCCLFIGDVAPAGHVAVTLTYTGPRIGDDNIRILEENGFCRKRFQPGT